MIDKFQEKVGKKNMTDRKQNNSLFESEYTVGACCKKCKGKTPQGMGTLIPM